MVCFRIDLVFPKQVTKNSYTGVIEARAEHLFKHRNAAIKGKIDTPSSVEYIVSVCDQDTVELLRDLPTPFIVKSITLLYTKQVLYLHKKHHQPPCDKIFRDVYWLAKSTERWSSLYI
jgi:hypothetical protein